ncbi:MAG: hypothetical protein COY39_00305 [Alphaproteobacteria bacterium CG_4_10_14_0_8_um_filter_37_21]|nr:MAG: hypothetical protein COY39_00305 [Alphaproteobacteria bacterium CG_4_10_14_0_8_um_filter_37_21]
MELFMLKILEKAEIYPVTLEDVKVHLRLEHAEEDQYLLHLIETATEYIERYLNRALLTQKLSFTSEPKAVKGGFSEIKLPRPNILHVHSVTNIRSGSARYAVRRYQLVDTDNSPLLTLVTSDQLVEVVYQAGFGIYPKHIPAPIKHALLQIVAELYENRGGEPIKKSNFYNDLLEPYRVKDIL